MSDDGIPLWEIAERTPRYRGSPPGLAETATRAIRSGTHDGAHIKCFNKTESDEVAALLPDDVRSKVTFGWYFNDQYAETPGAGEVDRG